MLVSANSKYDRVMRKETNATFTQAEQTGYLLFKDKCSSCHTEPLFTDRSYRNNGLEIKAIDAGRDSLTHQKTDIGKFRVPSLRNVEITGPYMHDGRFYSLKEVLKHYAGGVKKHANLDMEFQKSDQLGIDLTEKEQIQIISFLKTLTDVELINDRRFNNH
jgi:cytochrome c peroxidase